MGNKLSAIDVRMSDKSITITDLTDPWNVPRAYNRTVRGFAKALKIVQEQKSVLETKKMYEVMDILEKESGLKFRSYCSMD